MFYIKYFQAVTGNGCSGKRSVAIYATGYIKPFRAHIYAFHCVDNQTITKNNTITQRAGKLAFS